jgi:hypothetical protein
VHEHQKQSTHVKQRKLQSFFAVGFCFVFGGGSALGVGDFRSNFLKFWGPKMEQSFNQSISGITHLYPIHRHGAHLLYTKWEKKFNK